MVSLLFEFWKAQCNVGETTVAKVCVPYFFVIGQRIFPASRPTRSDAAFNRTCFLASVSDLNHRGFRQRMRRTKKVSTERYHFRRSCLTISLISFTIPSERPELF